MFFFTPRRGKKEGADTTREKFVVFLYRQRGKKNHNQKRKDTRKKEKENIRGVRGRWEKKVSIHEVPPNRKRR